jgi:protease-4
MKQLIKKLAVTTWYAFILLAVFTAGLFIFGAWHDEWSGYNASTAISDGVCNIAVLPIVGDIVPFAGINTGEEEGIPPPSTNSDDTLAFIRSAENDPNILGILARIDSGGGYVVAGETMATGFKNSSLPIVALIREMGASSAYLIATGADAIIASPFSDIGSIGVTMSYVENFEKNKQDGMNFVSLSSAKFKDYGNPDKPITPAERALFERDLKISHEQFVKEVAENRNLPLEDVARLADGSSMLGELALKNKLIDQLGDQNTARLWFAEKLGMDAIDVVFCE